MSVGDTVATATFQCSVLHPVKTRFCGNFVRVFFFQAEDGIRDLVRSRGLGDVYKRQGHGCWHRLQLPPLKAELRTGWPWGVIRCSYTSRGCLLYTSDAADERSSVDLGGRRIIKKKKHY